MSSQPILLAEECINKSQSNFLRYITSVKVYRIGGTKLKKFILGLTCGVALTATSAAFGAEMVQTYLFPAKFLINGESKEISSEYTTLNYNGHAYVPIRFIGESLGTLVNYKEDTNTITIDDTPLSKKLQLGEDFLGAAAKGKLLGIEFGIGASKEDVFLKWGDPHRSGSRQTHFDAWFDYNYFFSGPNQTVGAIGVSGKTIQYSVDEIKKSLGQPIYEGQSMVEDGWEINYTVGEYMLFFVADKKDGTTHYMTFKKQ